MNNIISPTQIGIFILKNIKAVGTCSYDLFHAIIIQCLNILISHHLKKEFIAGPADRITGAHFLLAQDSEIDPYFRKNGSESFSDLLSPLIKATGTTNPEDYLRSFAGGE